MTRVAFCLALARPRVPRKTVRIGVFGLFHPVELRLAAIRGGALDVRLGASSFDLRDGETATVALQNGEIECRWRGGTTSGQMLAAFAGRRRPGPDGPG